MLLYTNKGQPFLARNERGIEDRFTFVKNGVPVWQYFVLSLFVCGLNYVVLLVNLTNYLMHYTSPSYFDLTWVILTSLLFGVFCLSGPLFVGVATIFEPINEDFLSLAVSNKSGQTGIKKGRLLLSGVASLAFFVGTAGLLCGMVWAQKAVTISATQTTLPFGLTPALLMSLLVSIMFSVTNIVWSFLSFQLTSFENWSTWSAFRKSNALKMVSH